MYNILWKSMWKIDKNNRYNNCSWITSNTNNNINWICIMSPHLKCRAIMYARLLLEGQLSVTVRNLFHCDQNRVKYQLLLPKTVLLKTKVELSKWFELMVNIWPSILIICVRIVLRRLSCRWQWSSEGQSPLLTTASLRAILKWKNPNIQSNLTLFNISFLSSIHSR